MSRKSDNEAWFDTRWKQLGGIPPVKEFRFSKDRKWRFDRAWPTRKIALEIEGHGHQHWNRYHGDVEKYNTAALLGWCVLRITYKHVSDDDVSLLEALIWHMKK